MFGVVLQLAFDGVPQVARNGQSHFFCLVPHNLHLRRQRACIAQHTILLALSCACGTTCWAADWHQVLVKAVTLACKVMGSVSALWATCRVITLRGRTALNHWYLPRQGS